MIERILSDQGVNFESKLLKQLCILLGTDKLHTTTYHPAGNGVTERLNKPIKPTLAKFVSAAHDDWDTFLPMALSAYNNSYHSTIKMTPYEAQFGRPSTQISDVIMHNQLPHDTKPSDVNDFTLQLRRSAEHISRMVQENTAQAQDKQKRSYDKFVKNNAQFHVGDTVKITSFRHRIGLSKSFEPKFAGPYSIGERVNDLTYKLQSPVLRPEVVHYNRMLKFHLRPTTSSPPSMPIPQPLHPLPRLDYGASIVVRRSVRLNPVPAAPPLITPATPAPDQAVVAHVDTEAAVEIADEAAAAVELADEKAAAVVPAEANVDAQDERLSIESLPVVSEPVTVTLANHPDLMLKGKPAAACPNCGQICEKKIGLTTHLRSCQTKLTPTTQP